MDALKDLTRAHHIEPSNHFIKEALIKLQGEFKVQKEKDKQMKGFLNNVKYVDEYEEGNCELILWD